jgi:hypothetical protein
LSGRKGTKTSVGALALRKRQMDEISGDGIIIIDGENVDQVYYWLTISPKPGDVIAEGSITGSEALMRKVKNAKVAKLTLMDGPTVALQCHGGRNGTRWVRCRRDR